MAPAHARGTRRRRGRLGALVRRASINTSDTSGMTRTFACPFFRKDPFQHMGCVGYTLTRWCDVKLHLERCHLDHFTIRCPVCNEVFTSFAEREKHANSSTSCLNSPPSPEFAQFGTEQSPPPTVKTRYPRGVAPLEKYFDLWDTLFGKETRPLNPYRGPVFLETIAVLRGFWETEKSSIVPNIISEQYPLAVVDEQSLSTALMDAFDRLQIRFENFVRNRCSTPAALIPTPAEILNGPMASLDVGEADLERFGFYVDPTLNQGIEALPNLEYPASLVPQLHYQDLATATNHGTHHVLETSTSNADDAVIEGEDYQPSGEGSIGAFRQGDLDSEFPYDYNNLPYFSHL